MADHHELTNFIWQIADLLRGPYRPPQYERVMLPMTVLRRFDCVLAPTKAKVLAEHERRKDGKLNDEDEAELWRGKLPAFRNLYAFLSQIIPYQDSDLEQLYTFLRHLSAKLPKRTSGLHYNFDDQVRLEYYRLQKISEGSISLQEGHARPLDGPTEVGSGLVREEVVQFSRLIDVVNERFGTDFTPADQLFFDQIVEAALADENLQQAAKVNPVDKFSLVFHNLLETLFVERIDQNEEIFARFMNEESFRKVVGTWMASEVYRKLKSSTGSLGSYPAVEDQ